MTQQQLEQLVSFGKTASYNAPHKEQFRKLAMRLFREVRGLLGASNNSEIDVRFNAGGIAVSGDAILHSDSVYILISFGACSDLGILVRACDGRKDYHGKANHSYTFERLLTYGAAGLASFAREITAEHTSQNWSKTPHCDTCGNRVSAPRDENGRSF